MNIRDYCNMISEYNKKDINHLVLLSSGYDSTRVLYDVVQSVKYNTDNNCKIAAIYLDVPCIHGTKVETEKLHCKNIIEYLQSKYDVHIEYQEFTIKVTYPDNIINYLSPDDRLWCGIYQPSLWLTSLATILPYIATKTVIHYGLVSDDSAPMWIHEIVSIFNNIKMMYNSPVDINFPIIYYDKKDSLQYLYDQDKDLYNLCWCCECPTEVDVPCGECHPCSVHSMNAPKSSYSNKDESDSDTVLDVVTESTEDIEEVE